MLRIPLAYIDAARTRVTENICHVIATHCVTSPRITENTCHVIAKHCCDVTVHAQTARALHATVRAVTKHCSSTAGRVCVAGVAQQRVDTSHYLQS
jgi:hypothetical protein